MFFSKSVQLAFFCGTQKERFSKIPCHFLSIQ